MLLAMLAIVALVAGVAAATVVFFDARGTEGLRTELATRTGADRAYRATLNQSDGPHQQQSAGVIAQVETARSCPRTPPPRNGQRQRRLWHRHRHRQ